MNKTDIIKQIATTHGVTKNTAEGIVKDVFNSIDGALEEGENVSLKGFGTFKKVTRAARTCRNPQTGETVKVPKKQVVKFKPSKELG